VFRLVLVLESNSGLMVLISISVTQGVTTLPLVCPDGADDDVYIMRVKRIVSI
jgi:hypothetical protein